MSVELYAIRMQDVLVLLQQKADEWEAEKEVLGNYIADAIVQLKTGNREPAIKILQEHAEACISTAAVHLTQGLDSAKPNTGGYEYEVDECGRVEQMAEFLRKLP